ncbi:MAG: 3-dehydroquinate synthase family protein, partial [Limisphaerales bacterium]
MSTTTTLGKNAQAPVLGSGELDRINVSLGDRSYDILVCKNELKDFGKILRTNGLSDDIMVFTSPRIGKLYFNQLHQSLRHGGFIRVIRHDIPDGEKNKNWEQYTKCLNALMENFPESGAIPTVINLGGGVVGDIGGFAAGTFRRGVPYIQVPTTLLGDVDCGIGGKVGINFNGVKNIIGMFYQPMLVFSDLSFLKTLAPREIRSGVAEVIKYGAICSPQLFKYLEDNIEKLVSLDSDVLLHVVKTCYRIKAEVVK